MLLRETKGRTDRTAHLPAPLVVILANLQKVRGRGVFVYEALRRLPARLGRRDRAGRHQAPDAALLRHGFATGLLRKGIDVLTVAHLGGWKDAGQVLRTYGHANKDRTLTDRLLTHRRHRRKREIQEKPCKTGTS